MSIPFTSSDVWLLIAIATAESNARRKGNPSVRLPDVLFADDAVNKAVFTPQELRRGMSKLTQAGYVIDRDGAYSLSDPGRALVDDARKQKRGWFGRWKWIEKRLGASRSVGNEPGYEDPRFPYPALSDDVIAKADRQYRKKFAEIVSKLDS